MSQQEDSGYKTFICDEALAQYARVKMDADGRVTTAGLTDKDIGTAQHATFAAGEPVRVKLRTAPGTHKMLISEAAAIGALVYTEASGKCQDTAQATSFILGHIVDTVAPTADGDVVEVLYNTHGDTAAV